MVEKHDLAKTVNQQGSVIFPCPGCGKHEIVRNAKERQTVIKYTCPQCGFTGPN